MRNQQANRKRILARLAHVERWVTRAVLVSDLWEWAEPTAKRGIRLLLGAGALAAIREGLGSMEAFPNIMLQVVYWTGTLLSVAGVLWFVSANATPQAAPVPDPEQTKAREARQSLLDAMIPYGERVAKFRALEPRALAAFQYIAQRDSYVPHARVEPDAEVYALIDKLRAFGVRMRFAADAGSSQLLALMKNGQLTRAQEMFPVGGDSDD